MAWRSAPTDLRRNHRLPGPGVITDPRPQLHVNKPLRTHEKSEGIRTASLDRLFPVHFAETGLWSLVYSRRLVTPAYSTAAALLLRVDGHQLLSSAAPLPISTHALCRLGGGQGESAWPAESPPAGFALRRPKWAKRGRPARRCICCSAHIQIARTQLTGREEKKGSTATPGSCSRMLIPVSIIIPYFCGACCCSKRRHASAVSAARCKHGQSCPLSPLPPKPLGGCGGVVFSLAARRAWRGGGGPYPQSAMLAAARSWLIPTVSLSCRPSHLPSRMESSPSPPHPEERFPVPGRF